jgi:hypothetical protein
MLREGETGYYDSSFLKAKMPIQHGKQLRKFHCSDFKPVLRFISNLDQTQIRGCRLKVRFWFTIIPQPYKNGRSIRVSP